jgi:Xaa-Pro dipeptidase
MSCLFRQRRYFFYLSGVTDADCYVTYDVAKDKLELWVPPQRTQREILYMGPVLTPETAMQEYELDEARYASELEGVVEEYLEAGGTVYLLHQREQYWRDSGLARLQGKMDSLPGGGGVDGTKLIRAMNACRVIKDDWEIAAIKEANRITAVAHVEVLKHITMLSSERAVEGIYTGSCIAGGAKTQAYAPIAGSGPNAATLHYVKNNEPLKGRQLLLLDAGAEYRCYACDVRGRFQYHSRMEDGRQKRQRRYTISWPKCKTPALTG